MNQASATRHNHESGYDPKHAGKFAAWRPAVYVAKHARVDIPDAVEVTGPNVWAVRTEPGEDGLTTFTHLSGPGIAGVIGARR
jgi:hypothetical protein